MLRSLILSVASVSIICSGLGLTFARHLHQDLPYKFEFRPEAISGEPLSVQPRAIPHEMRFQLVKPSQNLGLTPLLEDWWKFPETTRRPPFAVAAIRYKDRKFPAAQILVLEWKHVPGASSIWTAGMPETAVAYEIDQQFSSTIPIMGTKQGTDLVFLYANLPLNRVKAMLAWVPSDAMSPFVSPERRRSLLAQVRMIGASLQAAKFAQMQGLANTNARALASCVQARAITVGKYDVKIDDYETDLGGSIPINPCTGTGASGYMIESTQATATVAAKAGTKCGSWTPMMFSLTL